MHPIPVLCGPTASGKTALSLEIADRIGAEVVSADSRQVYRYLDIGTAKPSRDERSRFIHHLIDAADPDEDYTAGRFADEAHQAIQSILDRGKIPLVVGGSGLYLRALIEGLSPIPAVAPGVRQRVRQEVDSMGVNRAFTKLQQVDPVLATRIDASDRNKICRGLEVFETAQKPLSELQNLPRQKSGHLWWVVYIDRPRSELYGRINQRVLAMIKIGLFEEVGFLLSRYDKHLNSLNTVGYKESIDFLRDRCSRDNCISRIQRNTRQYAKRQETWFRKSAVNFRSSGGPSAAGAIVRAWREFQPEGKS